MEDASKTRMNLSAIKKVDPYAKDIVDSSSHVAFYTFNSDDNEWEKTDVEGALFVYTRNAQPYHSIFINNRLNTTSFVEPVTCQLEIQSQPPFLLYRNERSRIRGFWFYNREECDRIGTLLGTLVQRSDNNGLAPGSSDSSGQGKSDLNIFKMLSKAQQDYNDSLKNNGTQKNVAASNVLEFFASARTKTEEMKVLQSKALSVEQLEKQQGVNVQDSEQDRHFDNALENIIVKDEKPGPEYTSLIENHLPLLSLGTPSVMAPKLIPPTMFDKPTSHATNTHAEVPLNQNQLVEAFAYLIEHDENFVHKLHEAYLKTFSKNQYETCGN